MGGSAKAEGDQPLQVTSGFSACLPAASSAHLCNNPAEASHHTQERTQVCLFPVCLSSFTHGFSFASLPGLAPHLLFVQLSKLKSVSGPLLLQLICLRLSPLMLAMLAGPRWPSTCKGAALLNGLPPPTLPNSLPPPPVLCILSLPEITALRNLLVVDAKSVPTQPTLGAW